MRAGNAYGVQVTFFRNRPRVAEENPSAFAPRQLVFAHAALADPRRGRLRHDQRAARAGFGLAGADEATTRVWIDDWSLALVDDAYAAQIVAREFALDLRFAPTQPLLLQGDARLLAQGSGTRAGELLLQPAAARGVGDRSRWPARRSPSPARAWLDHEWSSEYMAPEAVGWDWAGINLADGGALMAFRMRDSSGGTLWAGGTLRGARRSRTRARAGRGALRAACGSWRSPRTGVDVSGRDDGRGRRTSN